ncbi:MAG: molecular chaperone DnaJ [Candidatus Thermoplasmatota archaeon]|jgi:molecular chaperone DnaJ|nr:molecular chaperone DnaJ [Candidatus Thermoplasmatota archaeon]
MTKQDLYETLGISRDADEKGITKAYRKLAMKYHPDRNPGDKGAEGKFKEATEAYEVLSNADKKRQYDTYGSVSDTPGGYDMHMDMGDAMSIFRRVFQDFGFGGFSGMGNDFFTPFGRQNAGRGAMGRAAGEDGSDIITDITIDLIEAATGISKTIEIEAKMKCSSCKGTRMAEGGEMIVCSDCGGTGQVKEVRRTLIGQIINIAGCPECKGRGEIIKGKCRQCKGKGRVHKNRRISIDIPPGISDRSSLRLTGKGNEGLNNGRGGDLYVVVRIPEHDFFKRNEEDIAVEIPITIGQALLGDTIVIPTIQGDEKYSIKPGTEPDSVITMKGKGMPRLGSRGRGDQYVRFFYILPEKMNSKQKKLAKQWFALEKKERLAIRETLKKRAKGK